MANIGQICWGRVAGKKVEASLLPFRNLKRYRELNPDYNRFVLSVTANSNSRAQRRRHNPEKVRIEIVRSETNDLLQDRRNGAGAFAGRTSGTTSLNPSFLPFSMVRSATMR
jgi:hypothetical protein